MLTLVSHPGRRTWLIIVLAWVFLASNHNSVRSQPFQVGSQEQEEKPDDQKTPSDAKVRLLAAIIPSGEKDTSYFVKFIGPIDAIDANEKDFDAFLKSIRVPGDGDKPISWTVPKGWKETPAKQFRVVTLQKGEDVPVLYVSDPFGGSNLLNLNRWLGELGLKGTTEAELPGLLKEVQLGKTKAFRVDIRGPGRNAEK